MITKQFLKTVQSVAIAGSKDPTRYHLNYVACERLKDSVILVATNGHYLIKAELNKSHIGENYKLPEKFYFSADAIKRLGIELKLAYKNSEHLDLDLNKYIETDVQYPNWKQFLTSGSGSVETIGLNGDYISEISKAFKTLGVRKPLLKFKFKDHLSPAIITANTQDLGIDAMAVLMPCRV